MGDAISGSGAQKKPRREKAMNKEYCIGVNLGPCFVKVPFPIVNDDRPDPT